MSGRGRPSATRAPRPLPCAAVATPSQLAPRAGRAITTALLLAALGSIASCGRETPAPDARSKPDQAAATTPAAAAGRPELAELMRADLGVAPHPSDGGGRAWLEHQEPAVIRAGERGRFALVYEAGPLGIAPGGMILFQVSPFWGWSTPQVEDPALPGFTTVAFEPVSRPASTPRGDGPAGDDGRTPLLVPSTLDRQLLGIRVDDAAPADGGAGPWGLRQGDRVRIVYGASAALAEVDRFAERASRFWIGVDGDGDGRRALLADSTAVDVAAGPPAIMVAHLPSTAEPGATVPLTLAVLDASGSAGVELTGTLRLSTENEGLKLPAEVAFRPEHRGLRRVEVQVASTDVVRIRIEGPDGLLAITNPLAVSPDPQRILWADLHGHSGESDGTGTAEDYFRYGRDVAALDVCALTDHDHWGLVPLSKSPRRWDEIGAQVAAFHQPGRFVALHGFEWTNWVSGHRHVLYFGDDPASAELLSSLDPRYDTPPLLWAALRGRDALTVAHHPAGGPVPIDWSIAPDPELEPVVEVASVHGSSEALDAPLPIYGALEGRFARDALDRGYRLGFVGSGDSHDGHPGLAHLASPSGGLAAILAAEATRPAVLEALRQRRVYATNGPRIVLRTALDGARMGSAVKAAKEHRLQIVIVATAPLERVDIVSSGGRIDSQRAAGRWFWTLEHGLGPTQPGDWAYVRVVQEDGGAAWSSPFFFD